MGNIDIAIEYTEEKYTSRNEMSKNIGFQISDLMWKKVTDYRANFNHSISLKWFGSKKFVLCVYPTFASKVNQVEAKLNRTVSDFNSLDRVNGDAKHFRLVCTKENVKTLFKQNNIAIDEERLNRLISSENPFDANEEKILNYISALNYIDDRYVNNIDVDFLAELYSRVTGVSELTYFYRNNNETNVNSLSLVSRVYESAPFEYIEIMMDSLFDFIANSNIAVTEKALIAYSYILMVRPFKDYNEEIAVLIAKAVLAHFSIGNVATLINLESLNSIKTEDKRKINLEVQTNVDLTYGLVAYVNIVDESLTSILKTLREYNARELKNDFYKTDEVTVEVVNEEKPSIVEPVTVEETKKPIIEEVRKPLDNGNAEEKPVVKTVDVESSKGLAVNYIPPVLDEKTAARLEQHLLEMDVCLKRGEAYFYARHCSLGMYYTIDQYKKFVKCVYETARTSMDHLAELGYYSKKQVGKKFVYTPIERK